MSTCFVIQPFDQGPFDKRFDDIFQPAISAAGLEAYRVDRDPRVSIPIEEIEAGIRNAEVCLAEITTDNPNVWFELGFAIAASEKLFLYAQANETRAFPLIFSTAASLPTILSLRATLKLLRAESLNGYALF